MARCKVCDSRMIGGHRDGDERYCSLPCYTANGNGGFCESCWNETSADSPGSTFTLNSFGTHLCSARDRCPTCHSVVQTKAICAFFLPLIPLGRFRVLYTSPGQYVGRRLLASREPR